MSDIPAHKIAASFDSATVLHAAVASAMRGEPFAHLGNPAVAGAGVRVAGHLPWPLLRRGYTAAGAAEALDPDRLGDVDMAAVARWLADAIPKRTYPGVVVGSSNGAMAHLAAALQTPFLPATALVPVARRGDPHRPADAMRFGERVAGPLLRRNADVTLHHMHDQVQDELMVARMSYFRLKWRALPEAYERLLAERLAPDAPVILVEDESSWPVVRIGERHVFQTGAQGGREADAYLDDPNAPRADDEAPEAEWGADAEFGASVRAWCAANGHPCVRVTYRGPQAPAHAVASVLRDWYAERGEPADRLVVPSFVLGDPWRSVATATVPFWAFFSVQPALEALDAHLAASRPYREVQVLLFQHGVRSDGIAYPDQWLSRIEAHGAHARLLGVDPRRFPHDIGSLGRYGPAMARALPPAAHPWSPLAVDDAVTGLRAAGLDLDG